MGEPWGFLVLLGVAAVLCGPVALVVSLIALQQIREIRAAIETIQVLPPVDRRTGDRPRLTPILPAAPEAGSTGPVEAARVAPAPPSVRVESSGDGLSTPAPRAAPVLRHTATGPRRESLALEQRIGTRWALVAGVITIVFAVGFFLKYAYESGWIGPLGRVLIAGASGLLALTVGELTRRRGYDFAAKGVTALGFAILYTTVFAAHRWYGLLDAAPAYGLAVAITAAAMLYAVLLDEVLVAVLSLIGGYLTPVVLSRGENRPTFVFSYVVILSAGAALCASRRKWSSVSIVAFFGTYVLYAVWWERFYRPAVERGAPPQLGIALFWLAVFFFAYLLIPLVHTLIRRVRAQAQDAVLVLADGAVVLYFLAAMLMDEHRDGLALCSLLMGVAYLGLALLAFFCCPDDADLRMMLALAGLSFGSLAAPLYFQANATTMAWAIEAVVLAAVGLRYRSLPIQAAAGIVALLTLGNLFYHLPGHTPALRPVLNASFGTWSFVAAALLAGHVLYRIDKHPDPVVRQWVTQALYAAGLLLLMAAVGIELRDVSLKATQAFFERQMILVFAVFLLGFVARPLSPRGPLCLFVAVGIGVIGSVFLLLVYPQLHGRPFAVFMNTGFVRALVLVAALFAAAWLARRGGQKPPEELPVAAVLELLGILVLWIVMTEDIWLHYRLRGLANWRFPAHMYISVLWAVYASALMVVGLWCHSRPVRYLGLGIFVLLLAKVFVVDTRMLSVTYRIAGFLATGLALVGVSYLYQSRKKKGFFETVCPTEDAAQDRRGVDDA